MTGVSPSGPGSQAAPEAASACSPSVSIPDAEGLTPAELLESWDYLDGLRAAGLVNMWGATPFVMRELGWPRQDAATAHRLWMKHFDSALTPAERLASAMSTRSAATTGAAPEGDASAAREAGDAHA